ncbi:cobalamin biosynthesis protein CobW [Acrocarpospora pleiomorpha]|uniref:Cobalamin biosynthesis protein CobW n=1 Tax=Acrocarpospora pleiomorpha TaxID=90975 RepID=A0A5M3XI63_9ACTN|nr:GTP-binding protein [Acrocarpospora pleiomorpha]GES20406.1 cobalamin biosynthesis protein CobW [Acrocarpospora pleiomorpha]
MATPVVLVVGLHSTARSATVDHLLAAHPGAVAVHHDLRVVSSGRVERTVRDASGVLERAEVRLAHGCVSCTVREDLVPELIRRAAAAPLLVVDLWDSVEPRTVAEALDAGEVRAALRLTCVATALHTEHLPIDIARGERMSETGQGATGDQRYLAEVLARQVEYATALILHGGDEEDHDLSRALLSHLAPATPVFAAEPPDVTGPALCTRMLAERVDPATAVLPCDARDGEVTTVVWHRLRPLHPGRLYEALDELVTQTVRSRGRFWLATRHERLLGWDAVAGGMSVQDAGPWLAALPEAAWDLVSPARRAAAALDWTSHFGDRVQHLVFVGPDLDRERIHGLLDSCLLTPDETVAGSSAWARYEDPFAPLLDLQEIT